MFDFWMGDVELTTCVLIFSIVVLLPVQLLLCFKVRSKTIRLLPVILLFMLTLFLGVMAITATGWGKLGYTFLVIFAGFMLFMCGIGWGIWAIAKLIKMKKDNYANFNLTKECDSMKGTNIGIVGVCISLFCIALATHSAVAIIGAIIGLLVAIIGCFVKDKGTSKN